MNHFILLPTSCPQCLLVMLLLEILLMTVFIILTYWTLVFDSPALELWKIQIYSLQAAEWQSLGMAIFQKLPNVFWCAPQVKDLYPKSLQYTSQFICTWMKMIGRPFFSCHPFISHTWDCVKCYKDVEKSRQENSDQEGHHKTPFLIRDSHFVNGRIWCRAGGTVEGVQV